MNQQPVIRQETHSGHNFETPLSQLSETIRKSRWAKSQLDGIVAVGLEVAKETDAIYYEEGSFTKFRLYLLYKVAFEVWSYQHQAILQILEAGKSEHLKKHSQLVWQHHNVMIKMFDDLNQLASVTDPNSLRDSWLSVWTEAISELTKFVDIPRLYPVNKNKKLNFPKFSFRMRLPDMSPDNKFAIFATCLLVLAIVIATLLLIRN
ncbi:MAG: hypothetical protein JGK24_10520 [Microcoleus sp. PH2017_29_MFU_D_A]|uniref:hypothetical protein n=1 Tax=unclassified Microcoleus TaxID=2642155 RepID=UPI001D88B694|nr:MULTISPECIES: hypothetical protein [unclassified Microcoleus]MCC3419343.1 hypothetical protein [Microcoleus sp. PH2017_07_MST_O_A]MCC3453813.1 hypothetical protein [Microcoleus sp. PH2017_08_TRC_O_A]MCC3592255.1 hypothetical protein [Microcoleus sp. PH2017_28_MFU_U_A]MCC3603663.1 hypothetical protein [Microcoleus sp. PH2017_29_MFU_D_A]MCC3636652.1 hypothetical protein [Microcoleus sp. PH2017_37_MFU_D_B]